MGWGRNEQDPFPPAVPRQSRDQHRFVVGVAYRSESVDGALDAQGAGQSLCRRGIRTPGGTYFRQDQTRCVLSVNESQAANEEFQRFVGETVVGMNGRRE